MQISSTLPDLLQISILFTPSLATPKASKNSTDCRKIRQTYPMPDTHPHRPSIHPSDRTLGQLLLRLLLLVLLEASLELLDLGVLTSKMKLKTTGLMLKKMGDLDISPASVAVANRCKQPEKLKSRRRSRHQR
jgi:hypothetical protein